MNALNRGYFVSVAISAVAMVLTVWAMLGGARGGWGWLACAGLDRYFGQCDCRLCDPSTIPMAGIDRLSPLLEASKTGPATNIVTGVAVGFESTLATALIISVALLTSYYFGSQSLAGNYWLICYAGWRFWYLPLLQWVC